MSGGWPSSNGGVSRMPAARGKTPSRRCPPLAARRRSAPRTSSCSRASAYMLGRDDDYVDGLERAHRAHLDAGDALRAVRCAFWIGHNMLFRGETARASGWFARAERLLERRGRDCVERGYLLIPVWLEQMASGDCEAGYATAGRGGRDRRALRRRGPRSGSPGTSRAARWSEQGRVEEGLRLVDEALVVGNGGRAVADRDRASSTATRSRSARTRTSSATRGSGPTR